VTTRRILLVIPHPDDEVVGCATAVHRARADGAAVFGLYLTTGIPPQQTLWPWQRPSYSERIARRRAEAVAAAAALGVEPLGFAERPSRTLKTQLAEAAAELREAIARAAPETLWVPAWEGAHQDHDAANVLAARVAGALPIVEFAEYNFSVSRSQVFPRDTGAETVLRLTPEETAAKRALLALYASERGNLAHIRVEIESLRPLPRHDYAAPPHAGRLFCERFRWVPFPHPRIDFEPPAQVRAALAEFRG
jgi:LmbE family N-acetylglucosaminyl deacetylase